MSSPDPYSTDQRRPDAGKPRLVVIVGPTAVGKTEISIQLAESLDGEIVSADSRLFYRGMDIGTAKPTREQRARVPHHLIDVTRPDQPWSLTVFQKAAAEAIAGIHARGKLPFLVGGTGQYIHAVTHSWAPPPVVPSPNLRRVLENMAASRGKDWLHSRLAILDPEAAGSIDARNLRRSVRALEVIFTTGRKFSEQRRRSDSAYQLTTIGLTRPRPELYARIDARIEAMLTAGLVDEVRGLLDAGYSPDLPAFSAIGYRECIAVIQGRIGLEDARILMKRGTRIFVRRQANWFKNDDPGIKWFDPGNSPVHEIHAWLLRSLSRNSTPHI